MNLTQEQKFKFRLRMEEEEAAKAEPQVKSPDLASMLYHGAIEGGAMTLGGATGAILGSPAGPVGSALGGAGLAAAMYPPAKRAAQEIDRMRGITPPAPENPFTEFGEGLAMEAGGAALKPASKIIGKVVGKVLPGARTGEMLSGTPANNLKRAFKQGFTETYLKPKPLAEAGEAFGAAKTAMMETLSPKDQVAMMVNPKGEANKKVADVMTRWLKGGEISGEEALMARQGIDTIFPADTAKRQVQRGGLGQFRTAMNDIISQKNPAMKQASDDYAKSKTRSQLMKIFRVNKSNPDQYSKLGGMVTGAVGIGGITSGAVWPALGYALGTSPLAMGLTASVAGSSKQMLEKIIANDPIRRAIITQFVDQRSQGE